MLALLRPAANLRICERPSTITAGKAVGRHIARFILVVP